MEVPPKHPRVAKIFADLLAALDITATKLARDISRPDEEYKQQTISNYVAGKFLPGQEILAAIARQYPAIDTKWLLFGEGEPFPNGRYNEKPAAQAPSESERINSDRELMRMMTEEDIRASDPSGPPYRMRRITRTPEEEIEYLRAELLRERQAHERTRERHEADRNQSHERETQLIVTIGNLGKPEASADAADDYEPAPMAISYRSPEAQTNYVFQRYEPKKPQRYERPAVGFGVTRQ